METKQTSNDEQPKSAGDTNVESNSDMSDNEIDALVNEVTPASTKRSTVWGTKVFQKWQEKRHIEIDLKTVSEENLASHLKKYYAEVKKTKSFSREYNIFTADARIARKENMHAWAS